MKLIIIALTGLFLQACQTPHSRENLILPEPTVVSKTALDINSATAAELEILPGVGPKLAENIIAHRTRYGPFRKPEHLLLVDGFSSSRYEKIRPYIKTD